MFSPLTVLIFRVTGCYFFAFMAAVVTTHRTISRIMEQVYFARGNKVAIRVPKHVKGT